MNIKQRYISDPNEEILLTDFNNKDWESLNVPDIKKQIQKRQEKLENGGSSIFGKIGYGEKTMHVSSVAYSIEKLRISDDNKVYGNLLFFPLLPGSTIAKAIIDYKIAHKFGMRVILNPDRYNVDKVITWDLINPDELEYGLRTDNPYKGNIYEKEKNTKEV